MDIPTIAEIMDQLEVDRRAGHPGLRDFSSYSVLTTIGESEAKLAHDMYTMIQDAVIQGSPLTATGDSLDILVVDRLPTGRLPGNKATGTITFRAASAVVADVVVPMGSRAIAVSSTGEQIWFETTVEGTITPGFSSIAIASAAMEPGVLGNVTAYAITILPYTIPGIMRCENIYTFTGGTEEETDDDLRQRYLDAINSQGTSTLIMLENRLNDLADVYEAHCLNLGSGDVETIVDCATGIGTVDTDITDVIEANIAAGIMSRGIIAADILGGSTAHSLDTCAGGFIYIRPTVAIFAAETIDLRYTNSSGITNRIASATIPLGTAKGSIIAATMQTAGDRATTITGITYAGARSYDILIGLGVPPYSYITPRLVNTSVSIAIKGTATPEVGLADNIEASITAFLDSFHIDDDLEFSDIVEYVYTDYATSRRFVGIDRIDSMTVSANGSTISGFGQTIALQEDERCEPGTIVVTLS